MKILFTSVLAVTMIGVMVPSVFAEHSMNVTVENAQGSAVPGCDPNCFIPSTATIRPGGQVTFVNNDSASHSATSGNPSYGPSGVWDSSLISIGGSYKTPPLPEGNYPYFCMVHPWMEGLVIVRNEHSSSDTSTSENNSSSDTSTSENNSSSNFIGTFQIDQNIFFQGDTNRLKISGSIENYWDGSRLTFRVYPPEGEMTGFFAWPTEARNFETYYDLTKTPLIGEYKIVADYEGKIIGTLYFEVFSYQEKMDREKAQKIAEEKAAQKAREIALKKAQEEAERIKALEEDAKRAAAFAAERKAAEKEAAEKLRESLIEDFVDRNVNPSYYVERYVLEQEYTSWYNRNYPDKLFHEAIGIEYDEYLKIERKILQEFQWMKYGDYVIMAANANYVNPPINDILRDEKRFLGRIIEIDATVINYVVDTLDGGNIFVRTGNPDSFEDKYMSVDYTGDLRYVGGDYVSIAGYVTEVKNIPTKNRLLGTESSVLAPKIDGLVILKNERNQINQMILDFKQNLEDDQSYTIKKEPEPEPEPKPRDSGGGCLIATAAFGSEMAPQVQFLREIRDNTVMTTQSGTVFMTGFNQFYYSFSPYVADYERENPVFKEAVKVTLTPLLTSLTLLNYVDIDSEEEMLGYGIGIILLNIGMYFVAPAVLIVSLKKRLFL